MEVPAFVITDHLALINPVVNYEPWTTHYTIVQRTSGLVISQPFRKYSIVKKLLDDIPASFQPTNRRNRTGRTTLRWPRFASYSRRRTRGRQAASAGKLREKNVTCALGLTATTRSAGLRWMPFDAALDQVLRQRRRETFDRYTVVYSGLKNATREHYYRADECPPIAPAGPASSADRYKPLDDPFTLARSRRWANQIVFAGRARRVPDGCPPDYCELWHLNPEDHPAFEPELGMFFINPNPKRGTRYARTKGARQPPAAVLLGRSVRWPLRAWPTSSGSQATSRRCSKRLASGAGTTVMKCGGARPSTSPLPIIPGRKRLHRA